MPLTQLCAWCGSSLGQEVADDPDGPVSHGMCAACARELISEIGMPLLRYLETLDAPAFLVDVEQGGRVVAGNDQTAQATGESTNSTRGRLLGEVFECRNATKPGGCGRTIHCSGCTIRNSVEHTWETGEAMVEVPATLKPEGTDEEVELVISTERVGQQVLLHLDRPPPGPRRD